jgi:hypothetical protein
MTATVAPVQNTAFTSLRALILTLITCEVVQGINSGSPMPLGGFITMTELFRVRLSTNGHDYADPTPTTGTINAAQAFESTVQIDCYGANSADWAAILTTMLRDEYACNQLAPTMQPLSADDPKMVPLIDGEMMYEQRWTITALFQINATVTTPMQFADHLNVGLISVDATYPP